MQQTSRNINLESHGVGYSTQSNAAEKMIFDDNFRNPSLGGASASSSSNLSSTMVHPQDTSLDDLARTFNTALIASRSDSHKNFSNDLAVLMRSPAFRSILRSVRDLAAQEGLPERKAADQVISTFRKLEQLWSDYVYSEGIEKLRRPQP